MKVVVLHSADALEPPRDPVLDQLLAALTTAGHTASLVAVASDVEPVIAGLRAASPDLRRNVLRCSCRSTLGRNGVRIHDRTKVHQNHASV